MSADGDFYRLLESIEVGLGEAWMTDEEAFRQHVATLPAEVQTRIREANDSRDRWLWGR